MIRNRSSIIKLYKNNCNFIWYKSIFNTHNWYMTVSWSLNWKLYWYDNLWSNYIYKLRSVDAVSRRLRYKLKRRQPELTYKPYITCTKYQINEMVIWKKIKYSILFNYTIVIMKFIKRLGRLKHFFKNDAMLFSSPLLMLLPTRDENFNIDVYDFTLSKTYWHHFNKRKVWNLHLYKYNVLKYSHLYSVFSPISLLPFNWKHDIFTIFKLNLLNVGLHNQVNNFMICFPNEQDLIENLEDVHNFIINDYEFIYSLNIILIIYQTTIYTILYNILINK